MIVVLVITATLGVVLYTTFAQGIRLWVRSAKDRGEWKVSLLTEKMIGEMRNIFMDPQWAFQGNQGELSFAALSLEGREAKGQTSKVRPVYLHYVFDAKKKTINVQRYSFTDLFSSKPVQKPYTVVLDKVRTFELQYYAYDTWEKRYHWKSIWDKKCFPETIKITIEHEQTNDRKLTRMVDMPLGNVCRA